MLDEVNERYIGEYGIVKLTENETLFLKCLLDNFPYKTATYEKLGDRLWSGMLSEERIRMNLAVIVSNLNKKLKKEFKIRAIQNRGYSIREV